MKNYIKKLQNDVEEIRIANFSFIVSRGHTPKEAQDILDLKIDGNCFDDGFDTGYLRGKEEILNYLKTFNI